MTGALEALGGWSRGFLPALVDAAAKGAVLLVLAGLVVQAMRRSSAAARQMIWVVALAAILAMPLVSAFLPAWQILPRWARFEMPLAPPVTAKPLPQPALPSVAPPAPAPTAVAPPPPAAELAHPRAGVPQPAPLTPVPAPDVPKHEQAWWVGVVSWAPVVWLGGVLVCLAPLVLGRLSLWRLASRSRRIASGPWADLARRAAEAVGLRRRVTLLLSEGEPMPLVWGILRPRLLLPAEAETWPEDRLWVVLLHELGHARRRDCLAKFVAHVACAAHWFNPLAWLAFRWMQRDAEAACDDLVLASGHRPSDYATHLLEIASGLKSGMLAAYSSIAMARRSKLEGRLLAILDPRRSRQRLSLLLVLLAALIGTAILVPLSVLRARDTADEKPAKASPPATQSADEGWGKVVKGLQSRIVFERTTFKQGEAIEPRVEVRNVGDKPVSYNLRMAAHDFMSGHSRFKVIGPDGQPVPDISETMQVDMGDVEGPEPILKPGETITVPCNRLDTHHYVRKVGKYRITWPGLSPWPSNAEMSEMMRRLMFEDGPDTGDTAAAAQSESEHLLPSSGTVEIEVTAAPGGGPDGDLVGRLLKVVPPNWQVCGPKLLEDGIRPTGRMAGLGSSFTLGHFPLPGMKMMASTHVYVMAAPADLDPRSLDKDWPSDFLGKGPLGYAYLWAWRPPKAERDPFSRWNHAAHDVAVAFEVSDPKPEPPNTPDWGRMVSAILSDCATAQPRQEALLDLCQRGEMDPRPGELAAIHYSENVVMWAELSRKDRERPYYYVSFSIQRIPDPARDGRTELPVVDGPITWDGRETIRNYRAKKHGVDILITVESDDAAFCKALNAILDRELNRVLAPSPPATRQAKNNPIRAIYVGERLPNGTTRVVIAHDPAESHWPRVFVVNGAKVKDLEGYPPDLVAGRVDLAPGAAIEAFTVPRISSESAADAVKRARAKGQEPFRWEPSAGAAQIARLIRELRQEDQARRGLTGSSSRILGLMGRPAVPPLIDAYLDGVRYAGEVLANDFGVRAWPDIRPRWDKANERTRWRFLALEDSALKGCVPPAVAEPYAVESLGHGDESIRGQAIEYAGRHKLAAARAVLLKRLDDETPALRWLMIEALAEIGGADVVAKFIELLSPTGWAAKGDGQAPGFAPYYWPDGRPRVLAGLRRLRAPESAEPMLKVLRERGEGRAYLGEWIIWCLEQFKYRPSIPELKAILAFEEPPSTNPELALRKPLINRLAARALLAMGEAAGRMHLAQRIWDKNYGVGRFVAESFAMYGDRQDLPVLAAALTDQDGGVRQAACQAFDRITGVTNPNRPRSQKEADENEAVFWLTWWDKNGTGPVATPPGRPLAFGRAVDGLRLGLRAERENVALRDDGTNIPLVGLELGFQNITDEAVKLYAYDLPWETITIEVTGPDGKPLLPQHLKVDRVSAPPTPEDFLFIRARATFPLDRPEGDRHAALALPRVGAYYYQFNRAGEYRIKATYSVTGEILARTPLAAGCWTGTLKSGEITLTVARPATRLDLDAAAALKKTEASPPATRPAGMVGIARLLDMTPEQVRAAQEWQEKHGPTIEPARFFEFLKTILDERQRAILKTVAFSSTDSLVAQAKEVMATARARMLRAAIDDFQLNLEPYGPFATAQNPYDWCRRLRLFCKKPDPINTFLSHELVVVITKEQADRIIDHLGRDGYLRRAVDLANSQRPARGPGYVLDVGSDMSRPNWFGLREDLGWGPDMLRTLQGLGQVLDGDAAKAMDELLKRLEPYRKEWEKAPATRPTGGAVGLTRFLDVTPEQVRAAEEWRKRQGEQVDPARFFEFLQTILDERQRAVLKRIVESPTAPPGAAHPAVPAPGLAEGSLKALNLHAFEEALKKRVVLGVDKLGNMVRQVEVLYDSPSLDKPTLSVGAGTEGALLKETPEACQIEVPRSAVRGGGAPPPGERLSGWLPASRKLTVWDVLQNRTKNREQSDIKVELTCSAETVVSGGELEAVATFTNTANEVRTVHMGPACLRNSHTGEALSDLGPGNKERATRNIEARGTAKIAVELVPALAKGDPRGPHQLYLLYSIRKGPDGPVPMHMVSETVQLGIAVADEPAATSAPADKPAKDWPAARPAGAEEGNLPGSAVTIEAAAGNYPLFVAVSEATGEATENVRLTLSPYSPTVHGVSPVVQTFKVLAVLAGMKTRQETFSLGYFVSAQEKPGLGHTSWAGPARVRAIKKGERLILFVTEACDSERSWVCKKALPDTPENRERVQAALSRPAAEPAGDIRLELKTGALKDAVQVDIWAVNTSSKAVDLQDPWEPRWGVWLWFDFALDRERVLAVSDGFYGMRGDTPGKRRLEPGQRLLWGSVLVCSSPRQMEGHDRYTPYIVAASGPHTLSVSARQTVWGMSGVQAVRDATGDIVVKPWPPASRPAGGMTGITRLLDMTPEQVRAAQEWREKQGPTVEPARFFEFLQAILDERQRALLKRVIESPTAPPATRPTDDTVWSEPVNGLRWRARLERDTVEAGGPVEVHIEFQNVSDGELRIFKDVTTDRSIYPTVFTPDGKKDVLEIEHPHQWHVLAEETVLLRPRQTYRAKWGWGAPQMIGPAKLWFYYDAPINTNPQVKDFWTGLLRGTTLEFTVVSAATQSADADRMRLHLVAEKGAEAAETLQSTYNGSEIFLERHTLAATTDIGWAHVEPGSATSVRLTLIPQPDRRVFRTTSSRKGGQLALAFDNRVLAVRPVTGGIDQTVAFSVPSPQDAAAVVAYVKGRAAGRTDTANDLQVCFSTDRSAFEEHEPIPAMVEFRYLNDDPDRVLGDSTTARGQRLLLKSEGPVGREQKEVALRALGRMLPLRSGELPHGEWFTLNLGEHLSFTQPGVYRVWTEHAVEATGEAKAWSGSVRSVPVQIRIDPQPAGLAWSEAVHGLRGSLRPTRDGEQLKVEVRLQNVEQKALIVLPVDEGRFNYEREYGAALNFRLLDGGGSLLEREELDPKPGLERLRMLAQMEQPGFPAVVLRPSEVHKTVLTVGTAREAGRPFHCLPRIRLGSEQRLAATYDTRAFAELAEQIVHTPVWSAHLTLPPVALPGPAVIPPATRPAEPEVSRLIEQLNSRHKHEQVSAAAALAEKYWDDPRAEEALAAVATPPYMMGELETPRGLLRRHLAQVRARKRYAAAMEGANTVEDRLVRARALLRERITPREKAPEASRDDTAARDYLVIRTLYEAGAAAADIAVDHPWHMAVGAQDYAKRYASTIVYEAVRRGMDFTLRKEEDLLERLPYDAEGRFVAALRTWLDDATDTVARQRITNRLCVGPGGRERCYALLRDARLVVVKRAADDLYSHYADAAGAEALRAAIAHHEATRAEAQLIQYLRDRLDRLTLEAGLKGRAELAALLADSKALVSNRLDALRDLEKRWPDEETLNLFRRVRDGLDDAAQPSWMRRYLDAAITRLEGRPVVATRPAR